MSEEVLIVDCQVFQSGAKNRGMGKYSYELIRHFSSIPKGRFHKYILIFNKNLERNKEIEVKLTEQLSDVEIVYLDLKLAYDLNDTRRIRLKNEDLLTKYITKNSYVSPSYLIMALFLYEICPAFPRNANKYLLFYDLIPYLYFERYEASEVTYSQNYLERFNVIFQADKIFTISQTVASDMSVFLGIPASKLCNIDGASISRKHLKTKTPSFMSKATKYILMPSGEDLRKNNIRGVKGFRIFNERHDNHYKLIITSHFTEETTKKIQAISKDVIFSGNVDEDELAWLYENCQAVYFPTEYEGLGLPVLEAIDFNKPIACSNIAVFNEMSTEAFNNFDPHEEIEMADALTGSVALKPDNKEYERISKKYTWTRSIQALTANFSRYEVKPAISKKHIAILCPDPTGYSAIGKVIMESHYELSKIFNIDYFFERGKNHTKVRVSFLPAVSVCSDIEYFTQEEYIKYDAIIYHIGNSEYHSLTTKKALARPGIAVFHDTNLEGLFRFMCEEDFISEARYHSERIVDELHGSSKAKMVTSILNSQRAIICHSTYAKQELEKCLFTKSPVYNVNLPSEISSFNTQVVKRKHINIGMAGIIAEIKGTDLIEDIVRDPQFDACNVFVIGHTFLNSKAIQRLKKTNRIHFVGDPTDLDFQSYLANLNVLVNYRKSYNGETSLSTIEAMRHGVVPIVRNIGWFSELPSKASLQLDKKSDVKSSLKSLVSNPKRMLTVGTEAQNNIEQYYRHESYAEEIERIVKESSVTEP